MFGASETPLLVQRSDAGARRSSHARTGSTVGCGGRVTRAGGSPPARTKPRAEARAGAFGGARSEAGSRERDVIDEVAHLKDEFAAMWRHTLTSDMSKV